QIGFYVNTLPLRNQLNWQQSFAELLAQLKQCVLEASRYQAYPFDRLVDDLQLPRDMSRNPLFDVVLTMDDRSQIQKLAQQHAFQPVEIDPPGSLFDWLLYINLAHQKMEIALNYNTDLFELTSIQAYAAQLLAIMQQVSVEPNARLQDLN
ncbi:MAG: hypothetical protein K9L22_08445, partial [Methylococcaceae bacterium]|nr:hypothetical protein [Methylococcaceae bacterium]